MRKKKKLGLNEAANQLAAVVEKHLQELSPAERKRRLKKAHSRILTAVARKKIRESAGSLSRSSTPDGMAPNLLAARSR